MSDKSDKLAIVACWSPILQTMFTCVIALSSGWWAYTTYMNDQKRFEEQQNRDRYETQKEAISQMSRQLGLMKAQCPESSLLDLADKISSLDKRCFEAYIGARSLFFLSRVRIFRSPEMEEEKWNTRWKSLEDSLINAGTSTYNAQTVSKLWKDIVDQSEQPRGEM